MEKCSSGDMRDRVTIQTWIETDGRLGQINRTPTSFAERVPAHVYELSGRELLRAQQNQPDATHKVVARWIRGVTTKMQIVWHDGDTDRTLSIDGPPINPDGRRQWMELTCHEPL